ncbi:MAG: hypothetical protein ABGW87_07175 [Sphingomonadaceae bacterium]
MTDKFCAFALNNDDGIILRAFFNIANHWDMDAREQCLTIAAGDEITLEVWKDRSQAHQKISIPKDARHRVGCVISIYGSLVILLNHELSKDWMRAPNTLPLFDGRCAMDLLTSGEVANLEAIARYLLSERVN